MNLDVFKRVVEHFRNLDYIDPVDLVSEDGYIWYNVQYYPGYNFIKLRPYDSHTLPVIIGSFKGWRFDVPVCVENWSMMRELGFSDEDPVCYLAYREIENGPVILCDYSLLTNEIPEPLPTQEELNGVAIKGKCLELDRRLQ